MDPFKQNATLTVFHVGIWIVFEIWSDNGERVPCEVSREVLGSIPSVFPARTTELLGRFGPTHIRIEAAARRKLRARSKAPVGLLKLLADDLDELPPPFAPSVACQQCPDR